MRKRIVAAIMICMMMLCLLACAKIDESIDESAAGTVLGEYQAADGSDTDPWWHLSIIYDEEDRLYLSIYDNGAGNPGIEGPVVLLDDEQIAIEYDEDYYEQMPSEKWKTDGKYLIMSYSLTGERITLSNGGADADFEKEQHSL